MTKIRQLRSGDWAILLAAAALLIAGGLRYAHQPTFWLDEAFIAVSLRKPSPGAVFAPLEYGQYFPRVYLFGVALLRQAAGYHIWVLRLAPFLCFVVATLFWARLLAKRAGGILVVGLLGAGLLLGSGYWQDQAIQLKQYTFEVLLALIPFLVSDRFFDDALAEGKRKSGLALLAAPFLLSYTYPLVLGARVLGWYAGRGRTGRWRLSVSGILSLALLASLGLAGIWATDYRFNLSRDAYVQYWGGCILGSQHDLRSLLRLLAKFLWGWHGRIPLVTAGIVPLQALGVWRILARSKNATVAADDASWGSRSLGSLVLLISVILASALAYLPICAGRVVLFAQVHTQILAIEGALWILGRVKRRAAAVAGLFLFGCVALAQTGRNYWRSMLTEPAENLRPVIPLIVKDAANTLWVHPCSVAQVRALPEPLPVDRVIFGDETENPNPGQRVWILWSHLGDASCVRQLERIRSQARTWEIVHSGPDTGLALAEF